MSVEHSEGPGVKSTFKDNRVKDGIELPHIPMEELFSAAAAPGNDTDPALTISIELSVIAIGSPHRSVVDALLPRLEAKELAALADEVHECLRNSGDLPALYLAVAADLLTRAVDSDVSESLEECTALLAAEASGRGLSSVAARAALLEGELQRLGSKDFGDLAEAYESYRVALAGSDADAVEQRIVALRAITGMANVLSRLGNDEECLQQLDQAVKLSCRISGLTSPESFQALIELGNCCYEEGRLNLSEKIFLNLLRELKQHGRTESWEAAQALSGLASANRENDRPDVAIPCMQRVVRYLENNLADEPRRLHLLKSTRDELLSLLKDPAAVPADSGASRRQPIK